MPVGGAAGWSAFRRAPWTFPMVGYALGVALVPAIALPIPPATAAVLLPVWIVVLTGLVHLDGVADLADAMAAHGGGTPARDVLADPRVGTGGAVALITVVLGLAAAGSLLAGLPLLAGAGILIAAEVGAKVGMAVLGCLGEAGHEGLGSSMTRSMDRRDLVGVGVLAVPAAALTAPHPAATVALLGGPAVALLLRWRVRDVLGGVTGDVFGATNELGRVVGLHLGVIAWVLV